MRWLAALGLAAILAACSRHAPMPAARPHYVVGAPYQAGGTWFYPAESFNYRATGLAERVPDRAGLTADGERFDPAAMAGAHATLQLPAIADVTDLDTGRQIRVRLNDRGPADPGRLIGLTRQAADLLGVPAGGTAPVRVEVESGPSQALRDQLGAGPQGVSAAPVATVVAEDLSPGGRSLGRVAAMGGAGPESTVAAAVPDRLAATVSQGMPQPGQLWIRAGRFSAPRYANLLKSKLSGLPVEVRREGADQAASYAVMAGPFASVGEADAALDQARRAGVTDAVIVVE